MVGAITLIIPCIPVPWKAHAGYGRKSWNPRYLEREYYQFEIKKQYRENFPLVCPVSITYSFHLPIPSSISQKKREAMESGIVYHTKRPDVSNLVKFVEDTLKEIAIKDDSQVVVSIGKKVYHPIPKTIIEISPLA
jgi:Holliday junction resolvase RusA-like endonuclease